MQLLKEYGENERRKCMEELNLKGNMRKNMPGI